MATHSSMPAWRIPWTEEPGGPEYMGLQRVGHNRSNLAHHPFTFIMLVIVFQVPVCSQNRISSSFFIC